MLADFPRVRARVILPGSLHAQDLLTPNAERPTLELHVGGLAGADQLLDS